MNVEDFLLKKPVWVCLYILGATVAATTEYQRPMETLGVLAVILLVWSFDAAEDHNRKDWIIIHLIGIVLALATTSVFKQIASGIDN